MTRLVASYGSNNGAIEVKLDSDAWKRIVTTGLLFETTRMLGARK